ncbi:hypothetical protein ACRALDRAFT_207400 [Sodiomyces alcalophilus JCM 7366]|uniref:uncharacterized protein n=1 Tax=Sodiomyces alcalophilus JCM 7366 TaxID=591952 RepID=UPI0039B6C9F2
MPHMREKNTQVFDKSIFFSQLPSESLPILGGNPLHSKSLKNTKKYRSTRKTKTVNGIDKGPVSRYRIFMSRVIADEYMLYNNRVPWELSSQCHQRSRSFIDPEILSTLYVVGIHQPPSRAHADAQAR